MKPTLLVLLCLALVPLAPARAQPALLTGFGSGTTNPLNTTTDFQPPWTGTQTSSMVSVSSVSNSSGGIYSVLNQPVNISTDLFNPRLQLTGQLIASTPSTNQFAVTLYDSSFDSLTFHYAWSSFAGSPQSGTATLFSSSGTFNGTVSSYDLSLFGSPTDPIDSVSFNFASLTVIPEPAIWPNCLLALGFLLMAFKKISKIRGSAAKTGGSNAPTRPSI